MPGKRYDKAQLAVTLAELQSALGEGWVIEPPVERVQIPARPNGRWYCQAILWRDGRVQVLTVLDEPALRQFLAEQKVSIRGDHV